MEERVAKSLKKRHVEVARQVRVKKTRLDVVAYDKNSRLFKIVECKPTSHPTKMGQTFGQISTYLNAVSNNTDEFVDSFSDAEKINMRFGRWMQATEYGRRIKAEFYVALPDAACLDVQCLRDFKRQNPDVGILRYKRDGQCTLYVKEEDGKRNYELARATPRVCDLTQFWLSQS